MPDAYVISSYTTHVWRRTFAWKIRATSSFKASAVVPLILLGLGKKCLNMKSQNILPSSKHLAIYSHKTYANQRRMFKQREQQLLSSALLDTSKRAVLPRSVKLCGSPNDFGTKVIKPPQQSPFGPENPAAHIH